MPENVNINTVSDAIAGRSSGAPTAFMAWEKGCEEALALTNAMWGLKVNTQEQMYAHRDVDINEKFQLWKSQVDADFSLYQSQVNGDFGLYKSQRDLYDVLNERYSAKFNDLDKKVAIDSDSHGIGGCKPFRMQLPRNSRINSDSLTVVKSTKKRTKKR